MLIMLLSKPALTIVDNDVQQNLPVSHDANLTDNLTDNLIAIRTLLANAMCNKTSIPLAQILSRDITGVARSLPDKLLPL
jgi:hypothetical protein